MREAMEALETTELGVVSAGFSHIAYIRPAVNGETGYAVCSADGKQLALFPNYDAAFFTARQYNLEPVNVH
jgi:hypothetical protein